MSDYDIKVISQTLGVSNHSPLENNSKILEIDNNSNKALVNESNIEYQNPIFVMTPDGVIHIRSDDEKYSPDITTNSYFRPVNVVE